MTEKLTSREAEAVDQLISTGILDEIFEAGWDQAEDRDMEQDAVNIVRVVLGAVDRARVER